MTLDKTPKTFNARFESEVMWAIADLLNAKYGRDKTDVVSRAIMEAKERLNGSSAVTYEIGRVVPVVTVPPNPASVSMPAPFNPLCKHCGSTFGTFNRFASLCPECKKTRHAGDPRDCPVCTAGSAI